MRRSPLRSPWLVALALAVLGACGVGTASAARAQGFDAVDGLGLLVHQARHSLRRWFGRDVPLAVLGAAVGWPR